MANCSVHMDRLSFRVVLLRDDLNRQHAQRHNSKMAARPRYTKAQQERFFKLQQDLSKDYGFEPQGQAFWRAQGITWVEKMYDLSAKASPFLKDFRAGNLKIKPRCLPLVKEFVEGLVKDRNNTFVPSDELKKDVAEMTHAMNLMVDVEDAYLECLPDGKYFEPIRVGQVRLACRTQWLVINPRTWSSTGVEGDFVSGPHLPARNPQGDPSRGPWKLHCRIKARKSDFRKDCKDDEIREYALTFTGWVKHNLRGR